MEINIGEVIAEWTVKSLGAWENGVKYYLCEHKCGNTRKFVKHELVNKSFKPCKQCESRKIYRKSANSIILNEMYRQYKWSAKQRKYEFSLSKESFSQIIFGDCVYCGAPPQQKRQITEKRRSVWHENEFILVNGIDRINNDIGYIEGNCSSCCKICNFAKGTMSLAEWRIMIDKWYRMAFGA